MNLRNQKYKKLNTFHSISSNIIIYQNKIKKNDLQKTMIYVLLIIHYFLSIIYKDGSFETFKI